MSGRRAPRTPRPPRLARALLARALPADVRDAILGDLDEVFVRRVGEVGPLQARLWYARQAMAVAVRFVPVRMRERFGRRRGGGRRVGSRDPGVSWLDIRLGVRMLVKSPGLTAVVVLALGVGIPVSLVPTHMSQLVRHPDLPFEEGERIVALEHWDRARSSEAGTRLADFQHWRSELASVRDLAAARTSRVSLMADRGSASPYTAEVTASAFDLTRVRSLLGRRLQEADEAPGAPRVAVLGYDLWRTTFDGDPDVVGTSIRVGGVSTTVVGVMPQGFLFPDKQQLWLPLRIGELDEAARHALDAWVFGRLADGVSREAAQAELDVLGARAAREHPETHAELRPEIMPFSALSVNMPRGDGLYEWILVQVIPLILLAVTCGNVVILLTARAATRAEEIAVRTALGAGRGRIVSQFFVESLLLALLSTGAGLWAADVGAAWFTRVSPVVLPFWMDVGVNPRIAAVALGLGVLSAVAAGVIPALRATAGLGRGLQEAAARGTGIRFGRVASALIVGEVALGVACLFAGAMVFRMVRPAPTLAETQIRAEEFLAAPVVVPAPAPMPMIVRPRADESPPERSREHTERIAETHRELRRRLEAEPGVRAVAIASAFPGQDGGGERVFIDGQEEPAGFRGHRVATTLADLGFFDAIGIPLQAGRDVDRADLPTEPDHPPAAVVVNDAFVNHVLGGRDPIGRTLRFGRQAPPVEIVGLVGPVGTPQVFHEGQEDLPGVWLPAGPGRIGGPGGGLALTIRVEGDPDSFAPRLRRIVSEVEPTAVVGWARPLDELVDPDLVLARWMARILTTVALVAILLSTAGLYALMSVTISRRTREIGIRTALGGRPADIVSSVGRRTFVRLVLGVVVGAVLCSTFLLTVMSDEPEAVGWQGVLLWTAVFVLVVGLGACLRPTLRALGIRPVEALKADG